MTPMQVVVRRATVADVDAIVSLVQTFAEADIMLPRTADQVLLALDSYLVAADAHQRVLACVALREYSPSCAELVSLAVRTDIQGLGLGRRMVAAVEGLARQRDFESLFAHSVSPQFFEAVGYETVPRTLYPEKQARAHTTCLRRMLSGNVQSMPRHQRAA